MSRTKFLTLVSFGGLVLIIGILFVIKFMSFPNPISYPQRDMSDDTREADMEIKEGFLYTEDADFFKGVQFEQPHDILLTSYNTILVADAMANCIYEFDSDGNFMQKIGSTGNGMLEFNFPTAMCEHDGNIYIIDNYNNRIQVLSCETYKYITEIPLDTKFLSDAEYYTSIVSDGDSAVYISGNFMYTGDAYATKIIVDSHDHRYQQLQTIEPLCGTLCYDIMNDVLYMAQTYELKSSQGSYKRTMGTHALLMYDPKYGDTEELFVFPVKYMPSKVFVVGDEYYAVSLVRETIDRFDSDGNYLDTVFTSDEYKGFHYAAMDSDGTIFLSCASHNDVIRLVKNES